MVIQIMQSFVTVCLCVEDTESWRHKFDSPVRHQTMTLASKLSNCIMELYSQRVTRTAEQVASTEAVTGSSAVLGAEVE